MFLCRSPLPSPAFRTLAAGRRCGPALPEYRTCVAVVRGLGHAVARARECPTQAERP